MFSYNEIYERIKATLKNEVNRIEGSFTMDNVQAVSQELAKLYSMEIATIVDTYSLDTANGAYLDKKGLDFNERRNPAKQAHGDVTFSGMANTVIAEGTQLQSIRATFTVIASCTIGVSNEAIASAVCDFAGAIGNIGINEIIGFKADSSINGVTVTNANPFSGGVDIEDDTSFRMRIIEKIQKPITSGNENHYIYWAKQVSGVGDARCVSLWNGAGTVKLIILSDKSDVPDNTILQNVREYIELNRPIGASVTVVPAQPLGITIKAQLVLQSGASVIAVQSEIKTAVKEHLISASNPNKSYLSYHKIGDLIFNIKDVIDIVNYTVNNSTQSITAAVDQVIRVEGVIVNGT